MQYYLSDDLCSFQTWESIWHIWTILTALLVHDPELLMKNVLEPATETISKLKTQIWKGMLIADLSCGVNASYLVYIMLGL